MNDFSSEYRCRSDEELLQLWVERSQLTPEARGALGDEIRKRVLTREAESATDAWAEPPQRELASPVKTYLGLSVPWFLGREMWLRFRTQRGVRAEAKVESTLQSRRRIRSAARAELTYSYTHEGRRYSGRTVRDFTFNRRAADALAFEHKPGDIVQVRIDPANASRSYFPSGFGWIGWVDALWNGAAGLFVLLFWIVVLWYRLIRR